MLVGGELQEYGFRKVKSTYTCELTDYAWGYIWLNAAFGRSDARLGINPVVGVRYEPIEAMVDELSMSDDTGSGPTLSISLGYLTEEVRYIEWLFEGAPFDYPTESRRMVRALIRYGLPFMRANVDLGDVIRDLEELRYCVRESAVVKLPVAYFLDRRPGMAVNYVNAQLDALQGREDLYALHYRTFASNFLAKVTTG